LFARALHQQDIADLQEDVTDIPAQCVYRTAGLMQGDGGELIAVCKAACIQRAVNQRRTLLEVSSGIRSRVNRNSATTVKPSTASAC
jgi:hypothetical protein